jgi:phage head maturation protease
MELKLDIPAGVFDDAFSEQAFAARIREMAVIELLRVRRLHEHEAQRMLGIERWELVQLMERAGIIPTEKQFEEIRNELGAAINARKMSGKKGETR